LNIFHIYSFTPSLPPSVPPLVEEALNTIEERVIVLTSALASSSSSSSSPSSSSSSSSECEGGREGGVVDLPPLLALPRRLQATHRLLSSLRSLHAQEEGGREGRREGGLAAPVDLTEAFREGDQETVWGVRREGGREGGRDGNSTYFFSFSPFKTRTVCEGRGGMERHPTSSQ
jgi:hypothetical protein